MLLGEVRRATADAGAPDGGPRAAVSAGIDAYLRLIESDPELYRFVVHRPLLARHRIRGDSPAQTPIR